MSNRDDGEPLGIGVKDGIGLTCIMVAACAAALGYKILGLAWNVGFAVLGGVGLCLLWGAQRERRLTLWMIDDACADDAANYGGEFPDSGNILDSLDSHD
jgi:hypothetical protein